jgi:serine phosphatase RsbU (regulator of sigma subunit)
MTRSAPTSLITNSITCFEWITDGVTDIVNLQDEACTRLADTIHRAPGAAQDMLANILRDLTAFAGPVPPPDDITLLILTTD